MIGSFESPFELGILNSSMASSQLMLQRKVADLFFHPSACESERFHGPLSCFQTKKQIDDDSEDFLSEVNF